MKNINQLRKLLGMESETELDRQMAEFKELDEKLKGEKDYWEGYS